MPPKPKSFEDYLRDGCGRCPLGATPECKVHTWGKELQFLRQIMTRLGLLESIKWSVPCFTFEGKNIAVVAAFKEYCSLSFFKGVGLYDPESVLTKPGDHSQSIRLIRFTSIQQIKKQRAAVEGLVHQAIELERSGYKPTKVSANQMPWPEELIEAVRRDSRLGEAFEALTPGRQRGYLLFFSSAKQSRTRLDRIEKNRERIFQGLGLHDD